MGAERHPFPPFAWKTLARPLSEEQRAEVSRGLRDLLRFQSTLARWRPVGHAPDATPFVSLYAKWAPLRLPGQRRGESLRAIGESISLRALHDGRFAPVSPAERGALAAQVSYALRPSLLNPESAAAELEIGTHGVAIVRDRLPGVMILPHVARDERLGPRELLGALLRKARVADEALSEGGLYAFDAEDVVVHEAGPRPRSRAVGAEAAAAWLASLVDDEGAITFAIDPRTRRRVAHGEMHHGRAAVVVQALAAHGRRPALVARAKRRLERDVRAALAGAAVSGWTANPELIAGTMALAILAGIALDRELVEFIKTRHMPRSAWHGAQVVAALGPTSARRSLDLVRRRPRSPSLCSMDVDRRGRSGRPRRPGTGVSVQSRPRCGRTSPPRSGRPSRRCRRPRSPPSPWRPWPVAERHGLARAVARGREFCGRMQLLDSKDHRGARSEARRTARSRRLPRRISFRCDVSAHALLAILRGCEDCPAGVRFEAIQS